MTNEQSMLLDSDAANRAADADEALQELGQDVAGWAHVTATATVWDEDARAAADKLRLVEKSSSPATSPRGTLARLAIRRRRHLDLG
jgi:type IV secretory pathway VirB4 component